MRPTTNFKRFITIIAFSFLALLTLILRGDQALTESQPKSIAAPITVTKNNPTLSTDLNANGVVNPGDTLTYTVTTGNGATDATGVIFTDVLDSNLTLVPGSVNASPIGRNDSFSVLGNVSITVPDGATDVLSNDSDPDGTTPSITGFGATQVTANGVAPGSSVTTSNGGNVTLQANGSFSYNPPPGYEGTDSFFYTVSDGTASDTAQVTLNISGMIWFVKNDAVFCTTLAAGCGRLSNPFSTLASFAAINNGTGNNPAAADNIFIYTGSGNYDASLTLLNNQKLIGQGATNALTGAGSISGLTPPSFSAALPSTGGTNPTIVTTAISSNALNLASGNTLRGLTIGNTTGSKLNATTNVGTLTIGTASGTSDVTLNGTGQALNLTGGGTLAARFNSISSTNSADEGIVLDAMGGSLTSGSTTITNPATTGISVTDSNTGAAPTSSVNIDFGNTSSSASAQTGVSLTNNTGTITFADLDIAPDSGGRGFLATSNSGALTITSGDIITSNNVAVEITRASGTTPLNVELTKVSSNGGSNGIILTNTSSTGSPGGFRILGNSNGNCGGIANPAGSPTAPDANDCTGGVIQNTTGADGATTGNGIYLNNVQNISLSRVKINDHQNNGIYGTGVRGLIVNNSLFNGLNGSSNSGTFDESAINLVDLGGTVSITNSFISGGAFNNARVENSVGTAPALTLTISNNTGGTMQGSTSDVRGTAFLVSVMDGTIAAQIQNNRITVWWANAIHSLIQGTASGLSNITGNFVDNTNGAQAGAGGIAVVGGTHNYNISGNTVRHTNGSAISADRVNFGALMQGTINGNIIGVAGDNNSGSATGAGIFASHHGPGTTTIKISNNTIRQAQAASGTAAIWVLTGDAAGFGGSGTLNATVTGNDIQESGTPSINAHSGILATIGTSSGPPNDTDQVCLDIGGSTVALRNNIANFNTDFAPTGNNRIRVNQRFGTTTRFPGYTGSQFSTTSQTDLATYLLNRNTASNSTNANTSTGGFLNTVPVGTPCQQPATVSFLSPAERNSQDNLAFSNANDFFKPTNSLAIPYPDFIWLKAVSEKNLTTKQSSKSILEVKTADIQNEHIQNSNTNFWISVSTFFGNASNPIIEIADRLGSLISPTVYSQERNSFNKPDNSNLLVGETVCVDGNTDPNSCTGGFSLPANESTTITFRAVVNANSTATSIPNTANVTAAGGINQNSNTVTTTVVQPPSLTKAFGSSFISIGGTAALTFTITNPNPSQSLSSVAFTDNLPTGLAVADTPAVVNNCGSGTVTAAANATSIGYSGGTLAANSNCTIVVNVKGIAEGVQNNLTGNVTSSNGGTGNAAQASITVINSPALTKSFTPSQIPLGSTSSLQFTLSNPNQALALNTLAFTDSLPTGMTASDTGATTVCADGSYSIAANVISFTKPSLAAGSNCQFSVTVTGTTAGLKTNTTSAVTTSNSDAGAAATSNLNIVAPPQIEKSFSPSSILVNETSVLTISITNPSANTVSLGGVGVADNFPNGTEVDATPLASNSCSTGTFAPAAGATSVSISNAAIPAGTTCTFSVRVKATTAGTKTNMTGNVTSIEGGTGGTASATLTVTRNYYESDLAPRPDGTGDGMVNAGDITQVRRFVAGLDLPYLSNEFQRLDSAPLNSQGDGFVNAGDVTQARRYAAGLDTVQAAGGPTAAPSMLQASNEDELSSDQTVEKPNEKTGDFEKAEDENLAESESDAEEQAAIVAAPRELRPVRASLVGNVLTVAVNLNTDAADTPANAVGFTLLFDTNVLSNPTNIRLGANSPAATIITSNDTQAAMGRIGIVLDLPVSPAQTFPTGDAQLVLIDFTVAPNPPASTTLNFGDTPVQRFVGDINGNALPTTFSSGNVSLITPTAAAVNLSGRVLTSHGRGIGKAIVTLTDSSGKERQTITNPFGYYRFSDVSVGETYILATRSKRYIFTPGTQIVSVVDEMTHLNFISEN